MCEDGLEGISGREMKNMEKSEMGKISTKV